MQDRQKQRQQLSLRQKSYLATRALILEQPLGGFDMLMDRLAAGSVMAEKRPLGNPDADEWNSGLENTADEAEDSPADVIVNELVDGNLIEDRQVEIARYVASDLDEHGFFTKQPASYAASLGLDAVDVRRVLRAVQTLEPAGLGAKDVAHAIAIQISRVIPSLPIAACARFLRAREQSLSPGVIRACLSKTHTPCDAATLQHILCILDPEPVRRLAPGQPHLVIPDIIIERDPLNGGLVCSVPQPNWTLGTDAIAAAVVKDSYMKKQVATEATRIRWINEAIMERTSTLLKLGSALIASLSPYLSNQAEHPSRIPVEQLMRETGMSRTVMARALHSKYVKSPRGTMRLRTLVMNRWQSRSADVKDAVLSLLQPDSSHSPFSDREIAVLLASRGFRISRRTVAKYRLSLGIPGRYFRGD